MLFSFVCCVLMEGYCIILESDRREKKGNEERLRERENKSVRERESGNDMQKGP